MFEQYSKRTLEVIFAARFKAGERGSGDIDVGDLVVGLLWEDQGKTGDLLSLELPQSGVVIGLDAHPPFIPPEVAARLLLSVDNILTHSTPCGSPKLKTSPVSRILSVVIAGLRPANSNPRRTLVRRPQRLGRPGWDWGAAIVPGIQHTLDGKVIHDLQ